MTARDFGRRRFPARKLSAGPRDRDRRVWRHVKKWLNNNVEIGAHTWAKTADLSVWGSTLLNQACRERLRGAGAVPNACRTHRIRSYHRSTSTIIFVNKGLSVLRPHPSEMIAKLTANACFLPDHEGVERYGETGQPTSLHGLTDGVA